MAQISDLQNTTNSTSNDVYLVRQTGVDYNQSRETLSAGIGNARWVNTANYLAGTRVIASDGNQYVAAVNTGPTYANTIDPTITINENIWILIPYKFETSPISSDWNGYLDPAHTTPIEIADTSTGTRSFPADTEIAPNLYVSANTDVTFSTTGISWLGGNALYKLFTFTQEQLTNIDVNEVPVFLKGEDGSEYNVSNATTGATVTKPDTTTLKVEISFDIFATLGITKLWRFFVTERVGRVIELDPLGLIDKLRSELMRKRKYINVLSSRTAGVTYPNNTGVDIQLDIYVNGPGTRNLTITYPDSSVVTITKTNDSMQFFETIPAGATYSIDTGVSIWFELRLP